jgi:magnesium chelatase subunit D
MSGGGAGAWADAALAAELFATNPAGLGGIVLRAGPGPLRDRVCAWVRSLLPPGAPLVSLPSHATEDRLLGGLSLAETLRAGRVVVERGLLARADGGVVVAAMAERLGAGVASLLCAALDRGELSLAREGVDGEVACRLGVVALDEGVGEERLPPGLSDRLALRCDLTALGPREAAGGDPDPRRAERARALLPRVAIDARAIEALCRGAHVLGADGTRAPLLAAQVARAHAALEGRTRVEDADVVAAARLVLGPRATRAPEPPAEEPEPADAPPEGSADPPGAAEGAAAAADDGGEGAEAPRDLPLDEIVLQAARSALPAGLLDQIEHGRLPRAAPPSAGRAGAARASTRGGRPAGTRPGRPRDGERLAVVATLRAAAPWQTLRRRERGGASVPGRVEVRKEDFRVARFRQRTETSVIFCVDASGSAALQRLAEAKGAAEQVLADCYVRRDQVAVVAFRGSGASILLPSTRSLTRVRRCLAGLAGGGATPLAAGIDAALALALAARKLGRTPVVVVLTDGRANVARDGRGGAAAAAADAAVSARAVRAAAVRAIFLDTSPRPRPAARALAVEMGARYLPLPYLDAAGVSREVRALAGEAP